MTSVIGLVFGAGLFCIWWSFWPRPERARTRRRTAMTAAMQDDLAQAGIAGLTLGRLTGLAIGIAVLVFLLTMAATAVPAIAVVFAFIAGYAPIVLVRSRARRRRRQLRDVWPDVVDHISSAVRAGLALPESLAQLAFRGPEELRPMFAEFAYDYRATGRFHECLNALKDRLGDPVADRLIESLRIAREVGGTDLGKLLRTLSTFLRDDARTRAELEARQSWTVNAARLALGAPWIVLAMLATRGDSLEAYRRPAGIAVLVIGAMVSFVAYRVMRRIGRLPEEVRVMR
ncbi:type II secretion system F family protein [Leekyejoonella antrihumi]|uniref:Type II secretion system protein F n=1 Tax=Leekyejoonella antrihumi TaxID=1660198 RepID=A0A563DYU5_9MICO|nr:type II secretion system F family protein [Leekyejoonella antrihumi]TWP35299.1 type II secretion system protein F [Leekyejoonella antrihumi]